MQYLTRTRNRSMNESDKRMHKMLCIGMACVDIVSICSSYPIEDSDQRCLDQVWQRGGNASNTATVISLLRNPCTANYMGTLAKSNKLNNQAGHRQFDGLVSFIEDELTRSDVNFTSCVYCEGCQCPLSIVTINQQNGSRTIVHNNKNLPELSSKDLETIDLKMGRFSWIHLEARPNVEAQVKLLQRIDAYNKTQCDGERISTSVELEKERPQLAQLMDKADYVFVSKEHAQMHGCTTKEQAVTQLIERCRNGATLICPWGEQGAVAMTRSNKKDNVVITSPIYPPAKVVDTLGAGDTFVGGCLSALCCGRSVHEAINYGCKIAGAKCGMQGLDGLRNCEPC